MKRSYGIGLIVLVSTALPAWPADLSLNRGFSTVGEILGKNCSVCHPGIETFKGLEQSGWVTGKSPDDSKLFVAIKSNSMPPGSPLTVADKALIRAWIDAGAKASNEPLTVTATSAATGEAAAQKPPFSFASTIPFHKISGFSSASLLLAAGVAGAAQWITLINDGHAYRDAKGIEEDQISPECAGYIMDLWSDPAHQRIRWIHVGLLGTGEILYLANAVTGIGLLSGNGPGLTPGELHRYAFFTHGALMIAQVVMGFLTTSVISSGSHEQMIAFGAAHSALGIAIPLVVIASGIAVTYMMK